MKSPQSWIKNNYFRILLWRQKILEGGGMCCGDGSGTFASLGFFPLQANFWNFSFTCVLTLYSRKENCFLSSGLSQFLQDNWWSVSAQPQGVFTDWPYICPICGHLCNHPQSSRAAALPSPCLGHPMPDINLDQPCPYGSSAVSDLCLGVQRWEKGGPFPALKQLSTVSSGTIEPLVFILSLSG